MIRELTNTMGSPQFISIKEPPQKNHLTESYCGYTAEGIEGVLWGLSGERMADFIPSSLDAT